MHPGVIYGQYTQYHLFPDVNLGIYTTVNGVQGDYWAMDHIAMFIGKFLEKDFLQGFNCTGANICHFLISI